MQDSVFCSYIIPTIGRSTLDRAVTSVLEQDFDQADFEVIVVNDSGTPLQKAGWHDSHRVRIISTYRRERSVARNTGAAIAKGDYLAFLDDDDWILPGALMHFWKLAARDRKAAWLYGGIRIVDEFGEILAEINSGLNDDCFARIMGGAWAPIQASLIKARLFFQIGGFDPFICGTEDEDLCRRIASQGTFANQPATVACLYRGRSWDSSTNYMRAPEDTWYSRDRILDERNTFSHLFASAGSPLFDSYWYGRICRIYLSTVSWNLRHKRFFTALSRAFYALAGMVRSAIKIPSREFWEGITAQHVPGTLHFVIQAYEQGRVYQAGTPNPYGPGR